MNNRGTLFSVLLIALCCALFLPCGALAEEEQRFILDAQESGYYDLLLDARADEPGTQSLFLNGYFAQKVLFDKNGEQALRIPVYLDQGENVVELRWLDGDEEIDILNAEAVVRERPIKMVIVPHEDDEILGFTYSICSMLAAGDDVRVVFMTNGDYYGADLGVGRISESIKALGILGVPKENITFLGYPDGGLRAMLLFPAKEVQAASGMIYTYADPAINVYDYHTMQNGESGELILANALQDLCDLMTAVRPAEIYTVSWMDQHIDHYATYGIAVRAVETLRERIGYMPLVHETVIHSEDDLSWPQRNTLDADGNTVIIPFTNPFPRGGEDYDWEAAAHIFATPEMIRLKERAIDAFVLVWAEYNYTFIKADEFYWTTDFSDPSTF